MKYITIDQYVKINKRSNYDNTVIAASRMLYGKLGSFVHKLEGKYFDINCKIV